MNERIRSIVIVGGGTAGWLAALFLTRTLNRGTERLCDITVIESPGTPTIGVGEATVPTLRETLRWMGLGEDQWMTQCNATFKMAIKFVNWSGVPGRDVFWHPFTPSLPAIYGCHLSHFWLRKMLRGFQDTFDRSCYSAVRLCEALKSAKAGQERAYHGAVNYAYHLDAALLAAHLREKAKGSGVNHLPDDVLSAALDERGYIKHLATAQNGDCSADLFIDCTGFRGLLINQTLREPFLPYTDWLFCDCALAVSAPHKGGANSLNPYTTATAVSSGWIWDIPLYHRRGVGYVYCSGFISHEEAEKEFRAYLGERIDLPELRHLRMRVGRTRNAWVKNCVSVGLSSGFIEPLESTGILFIEMGLRYLWNYFPDRSFDENLVRKYNQAMQTYYEHIRDFIILHYCITKREDTAFWKENRFRSSLPETLQSRLEQWKFVLPDAEDIPDSGFFRHYSFTCILAGMGYLPARSLPILDYGYDAQADQEFEAISNQTKSLLDSLPDHHEYLRRRRLRNALEGLGP